MLLKTSIGVCAAGLMGVLLVGSPVAVKASDSTEMIQSEVDTNGHFDIWWDVDVDPGPVGPNPDRPDIGDGETDSGGEVTDPPVVDPGTGDIETDQPDIGEVIPDEPDIPDIPDIPDVPVEPEIPSEPEIPDVPVQPDPGTDDTTDTVPGEDPGQPDDGTDTDKPSDDSQNTGDKDEDDSSNGDKKPNDGSSGNTNSEKEQTELVQNMESVIESPTQSNSAEVLSTVETGVSTENPTKSEQANAFTEVKAEENETQEEQIKEENEAPVVIPNTQPPSNTTVSDAGVPAQAADSVTEASAVETPDEQPVTATASPETDPKVSKVEKADEKPEEKREDKAPAADKEEPDEKEQEDEQLIAGIGNGKTGDKNQKDIEGDGNVVAIAQTMSENAGGFRMDIQTVLIFSTCGVAAAAYAFSIGSDLRVINWYMKKKRRNMRGGSAWRSYR